MKNLIAFLFLVTFINTNTNASWTLLDEGTESVQLTLILKMSGDQKIIFIIGVFLTT